MMWLAQILTGLVVWIAGITRREQAGCGDFPFYRFAPELMFPDSLIGYIIGCSHLGRNETDILWLTLLSTTSDETQWGVALTK